MSAWAAAPFRRFAVAHDSQQRDSAQRVFSPTSRLASSGQQEHGLAPIFEDSVTRALLGDRLRWRKVEAKLNALPMFVTKIDSLDTDFIHVRCRPANAIPMIATDGQLDPGIHEAYSKVTRGNVHIAVNLV
jgi:hypothetical protein